MHCLMNVFSIDFSGFLLARLTNHSSEKYKNVTHLIIDEVHEREKDTDLLLVAVKEELKTNKTMKLILMSATMETTKFRDYFDHCIVIDIPGNTFGVEVSYLREILMETKYLAANDNNALDDSISAYIQ